ncbi:SPOR domain-containing protein [Sandaracinobacter sp. RS1-74]|uniref:SPOR domain-containing protein n=1 Tax=Sandaracinobacteroides sayramensis TaxID=2913411 RepID=UPI001EDAB06E|nr:SPOR domain-containing protein [Sandaracinobacteroides sayramensis]MCG2841580.1 SPOR domain-containing protein [Sandaracinobacteroides sayramensis]
MRRHIPLAATLALLAACSTRAPAPALEPARPAPAPAPLSPIHQNLDPLETVWHVRAGLNVAALSCAQRVGPALASDYNEFLKAKKALLTQSYDALSAQYRAKGGNWQRALDTDMTKLYNHFASPTAQAGFCDAAAQVVKQAIAATPDERQAWAGEALARLDHPFTAPPQLAARTARMGVMAAPPAGTIPAGWRIQLGAFGSPAAAERAWADIKSRSPELGGLSPHFEPVPGKPLTRLQVKGVENQADAIRLCAHASAAGFDCLPVRPA